MNTNVDVDAMRKDAVEIFQKGFACSESVIYAIKRALILICQMMRSLCHPDSRGGSEMVAVFVVRLQEQPCASAIFSEEEHLEMKPF